MVQDGTWKDDVFQEEEPPEAVVNELGQTVCQAARMIRQSKLILHKIGLTVLVRNTGSMLEVALIQVDIRTADGMALGLYKTTWREIHR